MLWACEEMHPFDHIKLVKLITGTLSQTGSHVNSRLSFTTLLQNLRNESKRYIYYSKLRIMCCGFPL